MILGIEGQPAPRWEVLSWFNAPDALNVSDYAGRVVFLLLFDGECEASAHYGVPMVQQVMAHYADEPDVAFVAIQTVFEGFFNRHLLEKAEATAKWLDIPVGHAPFSIRSEVIHAYNAGGTPWMVMIDRDGVVRFNDYYIAADDAIRLIDAMLG